MRQYDSRHSTNTADSSRTSGDAPGRSPLTGILQRKGGAEGARAGASQEIAAAGFSGPAMSLPYRSEMESGFGVSFSGVSAYGGGAAAEANAALGSQAYAVGQQIAFADSSPAPEVVAHELAHTIQQGDAGPVQTWSEGSPGDAYEQEADAAAATVLSGGTAQVSMRTGPAIQKWGGSDHYTIGNAAGAKAMTRFRAMFPAGDAMTPPAPAAGLANGIQGQAAPGSSAIAPVTTGGTGTAPGGGAPDSVGVATNTGVISFGAASRYGGDYNTTVEGMAGRNTEVAKGAIEEAQMIMGASTNSNHFYPVNGGEYQGHHGRALGYARQAYEKSQAGDAAGAAALMGKAMQEEGFGNHFLQDTFASGHMVPRSLDSVEDLASQPAGVIGGALADAGGATESGLTTAGNAVGSGIGWALGGAGGAIGGFASGVWNLRNPFTAAAEGASSGSASGSATGGSIGTSAGSTVGGGLNSALTGIGSGADAVTGFTGAAAQGILRSKQWHDYFCALPDGLPTSRGRFHGDYYMDGNDLEVVSNTCADSIMEVLAAGQGQAVSYGMAGQIPAPDFGGIMADPMAGPVWRLMMNDYRSAMERARARVTAADQHTTDGGVTMSSQGIVDDIYANTFGGDAGMARAGETPGGMASLMSTAADAARNPVGTLNEKRAQMKGAVDTIAHYIQAHFGYNANLGNVNDDMDPVSQNLGDSATAHADAHGFDAVQLEQTYQLYSTLAGAAREFKVVAGGVLGSPGAIDPGGVAQLTSEHALATALADSATQWAANASAQAGWFDADDAISYRNHGNQHGSLGAALRVSVYNGIVGAGGAGGAKTTLDAGGDFAAAPAATGATGTGP